jgi:chromatin remodeling complex protein RSC6
MNGDTNARSRPLRNQRRRKNNRNNAQKNEGQNSEKTNDEGQKKQTDGKKQGQQFSGKKQEKEKRVKLVQVSTLLGKIFTILGISLDIPDCCLC